MKQLNQNKTFFYYVYIITDLLTMKKYIGSRKSEIEPSEDIGYKYFSSSFNKKFLKEQKKRPDTFLYDVIGIFETPEKSLEHEMLYQKIYQVHKNRNWYNKSIVTSTGFISARHKDNSGTNNPMFGNHINRGKIHIYHPDLKLQRMIKEEEFTEFNEMGWQKGRKFFKKHYGNPKLKNTIHIYHPITKKRKMVQSYKLKEFLDNGWVKGRPKSNHIYNPVTNERKMIPPDKLNEFLKDGWVRGCSNQKKKEK